MEEIEIKMTADDFGKLLTMIQYSTASENALDIISLLRDSIRDKDCHSVGNAYKTFNDSKEGKKIKSTFTRRLLDVFGRKRQR